MRVFQAWKFVFENLRWEAQGELQVGKGNLSWREELSDCKRPRHARQGHREEHFFKDLNKMGSLSTCYDGWPMDKHALMVGIPDHQEGGEHPHFMALHQEHQVF